MPLIAHHSGWDQIVDATATGHRADMTWQQLHRNPLQTKHLACISCGHTMTAAVSQRGTRHFKHLPGAPPACPSSGESLEHQELKARIARLARTHSWQASLEHSGHGWRADVLTTSPTGQRTIVWEVQTSHLDYPSALERTRRHIAEGHEIVWLLLAHQSWAANLPTLLIEADGYDDYSVTQHRIALDQTRQVQDVHQPGGAWHWTIDHLTAHPFGPAGDPSQYQTAAWTQWPSLLGFDLANLQKLAALPGGGLVPIGTHTRGARIRWLTQPAKLSATASAVLDNTLQCVPLVEPMRMVTGHRPTFSWAPLPDIRQATRLLAFSLGWDLQTQWPENRSGCQSCGLTCHKAWQTDHLALALPHCPRCDATAEHIYNET